MGKLLLLSSPYAQTYDKMRIRSVGFSLSPIGTSYIAGYLKRNGYEVKLVDLMYYEKGLDDVYELLRCAE